MILFDLIFNATEIQIKNVNMPVSNIFIVLYELVSSTEYGLVANYYFKKLIKNNNMQSKL